MASSLHHKAFADCRMNCVHIQRFLEVIPMPESCSAASVPKDYDHPILIFSLSDTQSSPEFLNLVMILFTLNDEIFQVVTILHFGVLF